MPACQVPACVVAADLRWAAAFLAVDVLALSKERTINAAGSRQRLRPRRRNSAESSDRTLGSGVSTVPTSSCDKNTEEPRSLRSQQSHKNKQFVMRSESPSADASSRTLQPGASSSDRASPNDWRSREYRGMCSPDGQILHSVVQMRRSPPGERAATSHKSLHSHTRAPASFGIAKSTRG